MILVPSSIRVALGWLKTFTFALCLWRIFLYRHFVSDVHLCMRHASSAPTRPHLCDLWPVTQRITVFRFYNTHPVARKCSDRPCKHAQHRRRYGALRRRPRSATGWHVGIRCRQYTWCYWLVFQIRSFCYPFLRSIILLPNTAIHVMEYIMRTPQTPLGLIIDPGSLHTRSSAYVWCRRLFSFLVLLIFMCN